MKSQSLSFVHKVLEGVDEAYWEWDLVNDRVFYSARFMSMLGYRDESFVGSQAVWENHISVEARESILAQFTQHIKGEIDKVDVSYPLKNNLGKDIWVHAIGKVVERINGRAQLMFGTVKDITKTKYLINQLKKQNDWLTLAERISNSGHWRYDITNESLFWSPEIFRMHGLATQTVEPSLHDAINFLKEEDRAQFKWLMAKSMEDFQSFSLKSTVTLANKSRKKIEIIAEVERDLEGNVIAIFGVYKDITCSEDMFEKLKLLAMVNYTIKVPIFFIDDQDNVVYQDISPQYDGASAVLFNYINFSITEYMEFKQQAQKKGQIKKTNISFDKYNSVFDLSITYEAQEGIYIWIVENVTDKFRKDQQQVISNRLTLLGNTFGNVSHDINNVLGVALGAIEMLELKVARGEQDISTYIDRVKNAIDKGKDVTERLLAFTRKPTIKVVNFDPIQDIIDNQYLFKQLLLNTINIHFSFEETHCTINFPQGEFINILLNLVLNAQDAIQEKGLSGNIEISTKLIQGNRLEIHIKDSGVGIAPENLTKIFDPFYSSKSVNKGNGIGLANVYSTMYKHNGLIQVEGQCELGGAHFTLVFKCKELESKYLPRDTGMNNLTYQNTNILVLDDEVSIAEFVALFLESKGANVTVANNKLELQDRLMSHAAFDIFITDMILPDLSGKEAVSLVKNKFPAIQVFSISGYIALEDNTWEYPVLRKPFNSKELADFLAIQ